MRITQKLRILAISELSLKHSTQTSFVEKQKKKTYKNPEIRWTRVTQTLGTRLNPTWPPIPMRMFVLFPHLYSRPQRPCSFWSAPRIATSGWVRFSKHVQKIKLLSMRRGEGSLRIADFGPLPDFKP